MAAEFVRIGKVTRCRKVTRTINANGIMVETWGDFLPLAYCNSDGGMVRPFSRFEVRSTEATETPELNKNEKTEIPKWLLILAAAVIAYFVFKK